MPKIQKSFQLIALIFLALALEISTTQAMTAKQHQCRGKCATNSSNPGYDRCKKRLACPENEPVENNPCKQQCNKENPNPSYFDCITHSCGFSIPEEIKNPSMVLGERL